MSIRVGNKMSAGTRRVITAMLAAMLLAEVASWAYVRYEHHKRDQWFCSTMGLDTTSCEKLMEANRKSWGE